MSFASANQLAQEYTTNLQYGRAYVLQADAIEVLADCTLVLVDATSGRELSLPAHAVFVAPGGPPNDVGVELRPFDDETREHIRDFIEGKAPSEANDDAADDAGGAQADAPADEPPDDVGDTTDLDADADADADTDADADAEGDDAAGDPTAKRQSRVEKIRKLSQNDQHKIARTGELSDRVLLERLYGKNVWADLLSNPKLTIPEVARIARKGTVPRPLLERIVENNRWIHEAAVRRALLSNPRIGGESITKLLRITPKVELKSIAKTTAYSSQVREAARKLFSQMMG